MYFKKLELINFKSFFEKTSLHFEPGITAIVGPNGCGKCLVGSSEVTLASGSKIKIKDLVDSASRYASKVEELEDGYIYYAEDFEVPVLSLNPETLKIESRPVYAFIKRTAPNYLLKFKTKSNREIISTHYHPFFTIKNGNVESLNAEELKIGTRIASPRVINTSQNSDALNWLKIFRDFTHKDHVYIPYSQELSEYIKRLAVNYKDLRTMANSLNLNYTALRSALDGQSINIFNFMNLIEKNNIRVLPTFVRKIKSRSAGFFTIPHEIDTSLAKFLGYLISEGRLTNSNQIWFVNEDMAVVKDYIASARSCFDVEAKIFNYKNACKDVIIFSSALSQFLEKGFGFGIGSLSFEKKVPEQLFSASREVISAFLSGLFEGDAYISANRENNAALYIEYSTASKALAQGVNSLLLRLGVISMIRTKKKCATNTKLKTQRTYYSVYVYGVDNLKRLANYLKFVGKKSQKLYILKSSTLKSNPNLDLIPGINQLFKTLVKLSGINVKRLKKISPKLVSYYEGVCLPSHKGLTEALSIIAEFGKPEGLAKIIFNYLKLLSDSDIYWDEIVSIEKVYSEKWVYDLSILGNHNFVAQDIIAHNSNIFDGVRWVLGEQSVKSLRGSEMQDVIFNGTDTKESVGMAEVTLTFDNKERFFNFDHDDFTITRRLFRSGESEYLLNKTPVRLKDILDILMGTGVGAESYSMVAQGKIDLVLSSRPEDRRLVFDEASGITKYKVQKRETARRLEETEQNLLRVNDIVTEVKRQIASLERQANKARRYKEMFEELKSKEINLSLLKKQEILTQRLELLEKIKENQDKEAELSNIIAEDESCLSERSKKLKSIENEILDVRNLILQSENSILRANEHIKIYEERIQELDADRRHLKVQIEQVKNRLILDEEKLKKVKEEYNQIRNNIQEKFVIFKEKEVWIKELDLSIKKSLENISCLKKDLLDLAARMANSRNQISDLNAKKQIYLARKKRLDIEKAKIYEERATVSLSLDNLKQEISKVYKITQDLSEKVTQNKTDCERETLSLNNINSKIQELEKHKLSMESHALFLQKLKNEYQDLGESMNATVYLDKIPEEKLTGLVIKIKDYLNLNDTDKNNCKLSGEAKPIEFNTQKIEEKIARLSEKLVVLKNEKQAKELNLKEINHSIANLQLQLRNQEITLANKESIRSNIEEQLKKVQEEEEVVVMESQDTSRELEVLNKNISHYESGFCELNREQLKREDSIIKEEEHISNSSSLREETLVIITQTKTELQALNNRLISDEATLKILQDTYSQDSSSINNLENRIRDNENKKESLYSEIKENLERIEEFNKQIEDSKKLLTLKQKEQEGFSLGMGETFKKIDEQKRVLEDLKNSLHELEMTEKDIEYKYSTIKMRMLQVYKVDIDSLEDLKQKIDEDALFEEIERLKQRVDSYGTVNLIAIEEYDELKKRYDFLIQQQNDLLQAKESLHQAILKINRITKQMFLETFEKVKVEFKNYFKLLFNGGDAQVFLLDEHDPLESGIEIICRPPGKKLQNVLLLSGGEKSLSAIALIFAIFKVKPSPFCILDEIDAALDEANVDRFSRLLQEFSKQSQFVVITHNKRTIANANVMYGITMEESGVSKIVSVKFSKEEEREKGVVEVAA